MARAARPQDFSDDGNIHHENEEKFLVRLDSGQWKLLCTDTVVDQPTGPGAFCSLALFTPGSWTLFLQAFVPGRHVAL